MKAKPFHFKKFTIHQDQCAMKVGTDGVLLGAWAKTVNTSNILDVGSGTGLISLMLAQRTSANITALEIDLHAAKQCKENCTSSPWRDRIQIHHQSFQQYAKQNTKPFDLIISNPPFFEKSNKQNSRSVARSEQELSFEELFKLSASFLKPTGKLSIIFPANREEEVIQLCAAHNLFPSKICYVRGKENAPIKRIMLTASGQNNITCIKEELVIERKERHDYTEEYKNLLKNYLTIF